MRYAFGDESFASVDGHGFYVVGLVVLDFDQAALARDYTWSMGRSGGRMCN